MTKLQKYIKDNKLDEVRVMNALQNNGVVSDCAVWAKDVAEEDAAIAFLKRLKGLYESKS